MNTAKKMGRPKLSSSESRGMVEKLRVNKKEREAIRKAAENEEMSLTEWMRKKLLDAAGFRQVA